MPYIGVAPSSGLFKKLDSISIVNNQAAYTMQYNSSNFKPATAEQLIVSVNGVIQAPNDAYTVSGSTITFSENLVTGDVIDFIVALGEVGNTVTPVDGSVDINKMSSSLMTESGGSTTFKVDNIQNSSGTNAISIDSSGVVKQNQLPFFHAHDVTNNSGQSGWITMNWTNRDVTNKIDWDATNYRIKPTVAGYYQINFNYAHTSGDHTDLAIRVNHSVYGVVAVNNANSSNSRSLTTVTYFDGTDDYITTDAYHSNTGHPTNNDDRKTNVTVYLVRAD